MTPDYDRRHIAFRDDDPDPEQVERLKASLRSVIKDSGKILDATVAGPRGGGFTVTVSTAEAAEKVREWYKYNRAKVDKAHGAWRVTVPNGRKHAALVD